MNGCCIHIMWKGKDVFVTSVCSKSVMTVIGQIIHIAFMAISVKMMIIKMGESDVVEKFPMERLWDQEWER